MSNRAKEIAAIMATYEEGQVWQRRRRMGGEWKDLHDSPWWDWSTSDYRRKPEPPAPKYRPWTPEEGIGKVVRHKNDKTWCHMLVGYSAGKFNLGSEFRAYDDTLLIEYTQLDGSPCGVLETPTTN